MPGGRDGRSPAILVQAGRLGRADPGWRAARQEATVPGRVRTQKVEDFPTVVLKRRRFPLTRCRSVGEDADRKS